METMPTIVTQTWDRHARVIKAISQHCHGIHVHVTFHAITVRQKHSETLSSISAGAKSEGPTYAGRMVSRGRTRVTHCYLGIFLA